MIKVCPRIIDNCENHGPDDDDDDNVGIWWVPRQARLVPRVLIYHSANKMVVIVLMEEGGDDCIDDDHDHMDIIWCWSNLDSLICERGWCICPHANKNPDDMSSLLIFFREQEVKEERNQQRGFGRNEVTDLRRGEDGQRVIFKEVGCIVWMAVRRLSQVNWILAWERAGAKMNTEYLGGVCCDPGQPCAPLLRGWEQLSLFWARVEGEVRGRKRQVRHSQPAGQTKLCDLSKSHTATSSKTRWESSRDQWGKILLWTKCAREWLKEGSPPKNWGRLMPTMQEIVNKASLETRLWVTKLESAKIPLQNLMRKVENWEVCCSSVPPSFLSSFFSSRLWPRYNQSSLLFSF